MLNVEWVSRTAIAAGIDYQTPLSLPFSLFPFPLSPFPGYRFPANPYSAIALMPAKFLIVCRCALM